MFACSKCEVLTDETKFLREEVRRLTDRLIALTSPQAFNAVQFAPPSGEFYGTEADEMIEYHPVTGQKILVTKKQ